MYPRIAPDTGTRSRTLAHDASRVYRGEKKKAARSWNVAAFSLVPGAAPQLRLETRMDARFDFAWVKMYPQMYPLTAKDTPRHEAD